MNSTLCVTKYDSDIYLVGVYPTPTARARDAICAISFHGHDWSPTPRKTTDQPDGSYSLRPTLSKDDIKVGHQVQRNESGQRTVKICCLRLSHPHQGWAFFSTEGVHTLAHKILSLCCDTKSLVLEIQVVWWWSCGCMTSLGSNPGAYKYYAQANEISTWL